MKASEVRVNNIAVLNGELIRIKPNDIVRMADQEEFNITSVYCPVRITEEWLLNSGFKKTVSFWMPITRKDSTRDSLELSKYDHNKYDWYVYYRNFNSGVPDDYVYLRNNLKYVHQLQNLYFALTGEELTIKT